MSTYNNDSPVRLGLYGRGTVQSGQPCRGSGGFGQLQGELRHGVGVASLLLLLLLDWHGGWWWCGWRCSWWWWGRLWSVHTSVCTAVEAAEAVVGTIWAVMFILQQSDLVLTCVSLSWTPAVGHWSSLTLTSRPGGGALLTVGGSGARHSEGSLCSSVESSGGGAVNIEPAGHHNVMSSSKSGHDVENTFSSWQECRQSLLLNFTIQITNDSPPVTHKYLLIEDRPVGTEKWDGPESLQVVVRQTDVVGLAVLGRVGVVAAQDQPGAGEVGGLDRGEDGIVQAGLSGHWDTPPRQGYWRTGLKIFMIVIFYILKNK